jgi:hypothetical protein
MASQFVTRRIVGAVGTAHSIHRQAVVSYHYRGPEQ